MKNRKSLDLTGKQVQKAQSPKTSRSTELIFEDEPSMSAVGIDMMGRTKKRLQSPNTCGTCRFARALADNDSVISCQRNPPAVTAVVGAQVSSTWPLLGKENWCGEHSKRK